MRLQLLDKFEQWNSNNEEKKPVPKCLQDEKRCLLPTRMPAWLPKNDDRFNVEKKKSGSLSATHLFAKKSFVFLPHDSRRGIGVRSASSRAPSLIRTGTISLPS